MTLEVLGTFAKEGIRLVSRMAEPTVTAAGPALRDRDDEREISAAVPHLTRLGLAAVATWRAGDRVKMGQGYSETNTRDHSEVELTSLGHALCRACLGPSPERHATES